MIMKMFLFDFMVCLLITLMLMSAVQQEECDFYEKYYKAYKH